MSLQKILVAQGSGPTALVNRPAGGVAPEAREFAVVERLHGAALRTRGCVDENFVALSQQTSGGLEEVAHAPSSALAGPGPDLCLVKPGCAAGLDRAELAPADLCRAGA